MRGKKELDLFLYIYRELVLPDIVHNGGNDIDHVCSLIRPKLERGE